MLPVGEGLREEGVVLEVVVSREAEVVAHNATLFSWVLLRLLLDLSLGEKTLH